MNNGTDAGRPPLLQGTDIYKSFKQGVTVIEVLKGINIEVDTGEMVAIVGASGSGKTTLLQILGTLDAPSSGTIIFDGRDLVKAREKDLSRHRNENVGFIFQFHHLLPEFSALENVMMPGLIKGRSSRELEERARKLLDQVNLSHRENHRSGELSGGEQQRVALARALIMQPALLLADEPTGNLDSTSGRQVFDLLREMSRSLSLSVIMVTHNQELAADMDRRLTLKDGLLTS
ncbi:MAG: ABC transporter ATP-binding protein [Desulfobulbaceae bacterium]|nr:ABC transporter ATP-binding protein [Desulfobulbaceae bacterium]